MQSLEQGKFSIISLAKFILQFKISLLKIKSKYMKINFEQVMHMLTVVYFS